MSELDLRLHCLALAVQVTPKTEHPTLLNAMAQSIYDFLVPGIAGRGVEHNAANVHSGHPTIQ